PGASGSGVIVKLDDDPEMRRPDYWLAHLKFARTLGKYNGGVALGRAARRRQQSRGRGKAAEGYASDGRCQQGLFALPLIAALEVHNEPRSSHIQTARRYRRDQGC